MSERVYTCDGCHNASQIIASLATEIADLTAENEKLNSYQARLATDLAAYMVGNENLKEGNQRMRAALERISKIAPDHHQPVHAGIFTIFDICREALGAENEV